MIKSNKLRKDSCGYMAQLCDISTTKGSYSSISIRYAWSKIFRENLEITNAKDLIEEIEFVNNKQREEISDRIIKTLTRIRSSIDLIGLERISGYTKVIENFNGKEILISVDALYKYENKVYGVIAKDKYRDRIKKKTFSNIGTSKKTYEGLLACEYIFPSLNGIIYIDLHPFFELKDDTDESFINAHFSFYDHCKSNDKLEPIDIKLQDSSKKDNCFICKYKIFCAEQKFREQIPLTVALEENSIKNFTLTNSQKDFSEILAGVIKVNAVAGSGKTTSIAMRIINIVKANYLPEDILCISFTNNAATEMKEKIAKLANADISERCNIYTFHGFCQKILEDNYKKFGYTHIPTVATKVDKIKILNDILDKMPKINGLRYEDPLLNMKNAKGSLFQIYDLVDEYLKRGFLENKEIELDVYGVLMEMEKEMIAKNLIDLNSLISWINKLDLSPYQFSHIIIDEGQDTSNIQFEIVTKISRNAISLAVAGDPMQSIFGWLYLDVDNLINFNKNFHSVKEINFSENFRTTKEIADFANKLITGGPKIQAFKNGPAPKILKIEDYNEINDIIRLHNSFKYGTIGILARYKKQSEMLNIQYNSGAKYLFKQDIVLSVKKLAEYILNGTNSECILEFLKYTNSISDDLSLEDLKNKYQEKVIEIKDLEKTFEYYGSKKQFFLYLLGHFKDEDGILSNIDFNKFNDLADIYHYLKESIMFDDDTTFVTKNESNILFTTVHASKGSEFDTVILLLDSFDISNDESIRLLYTAVTRAKENLYLVYKDNADKIISLFQ